MRNIENKDGDPNNLEYVICSALYEMRIEEEGFALLSSGVTDDLDFENGKKRYLPYNRERVFRTNKTVTELKDMLLAVWDRVYGSKFRYDVRDTDSITIITNGVLITSDASLVARKLTKPGYVLGDNTVRIKGSVEVKGFPQEVSRYYGLCNALYEMGISVPGLILKATGNNNYLRGTGYGSTSLAVIYTRSFYTNYSIHDLEKLLIDTWNVTYDTRTFRLDAVPYAGVILCNDTIRSYRDWMIDPTVLKNDVNDKLVSMYECYRK